jgi:hypothetical protein
MTMTTRTRAATAIVRVSTMTLLRNSGYGWAPIDSGPGGLYPIDRL